MTKLCTEAQQVAAPLFFTMQNWIVVEFIWVPVWIHPITKKIKDNWKPCYGNKCVCVANLFQQFVNFSVLTKSCIYMVVDGCLDGLLFRGFCIESFLGVGQLNWTLDLEILHKKNGGHVSRKINIDASMSFPERLRLSQVSNTHTLHLVVISKVSHLGISHRQVCGPHAGWILKRRKRKEKHRARTSISCQLSAITCSNNAL